MSDNSLSPSRAAAQRQTTCATCLAMRLVVVLGLPIIFLLLALISSTAAASVPLWVLVGFLASLTAPMWLGHLEAGR